MVIYFYLLCIHWAALPLPNVQMGISASTLLDNTIKMRQAARDAAKLLTVICDCGASNFVHHQTLQKLLVEDPDNAVIPLCDGHKCRNILVPLRKGEQYIYKGILLLRLNS